MLRFGSDSWGAPSGEGAPRRRAVGAVAVTFACLLLAGCGPKGDGSVASASTQSADAENPTVFPFDPEFSLTRAQHEEMRSCIVTKLGTSIESEADEDRAGRAFVVCAHELGHDDAYWPDEDAQAREMLRSLTVDEEPSFLEQLIPFS